MFLTIKYKPVIAIVTILAILILGVLSALAAAPTNDEFVNANQIASLPFSDGIDTSEATTSGDDPWPSCNYYNVYEATVWYQFTPSEDMLLVASTAGSNYTANLGVFTGSAGSFEEIACAIDNNPVSFQVQTGVTYSIMIAAVSGPWNPYPPPVGYGGWLNFSLDVAPPPVVYFDYWSYPWYGLRAFQFSNQSYDPVCPWCGMSAYWDFGDGTTSSEWSPFHQYQTDGSYRVSLTVITYDGREATIEREIVVSTPPPVASFDPNPYNPSTFDTVYFSNWSYDPACYWCAMSAAWDFGDGASSSEWSPSHQYSADGDYTVNLTVTTTDGRTASASRLLQVRTIDVAIYGFTVPQSAKVGQTRSVTVEVSNTRYPVTVEVQLYKSTVGGWQWFGSLQQYVPVRSSNRTTRFEFSYTFTKEDAQLGKINFKAVASVVNGRDAIPTNNEAISLPTKVAR